MAELRQETTEQWSTAEQETRSAVALDPHPLWLEAIGTMLAKDEIELVGRATTASDAFAALGESNPDIFVTELQLPGSGPQGAAIVRQARERVPGLTVIVLSSSDAVDDIANALDAGANAYILKTARPEDLSLVIRQAFDRSIYLPGQRPASPQAARGAALGTEDLTRRELEILRHVAEGRSNQQVGRTLWVTEQTVKFHLTNIYRKLGMSNRTEASLWAQRHGLLTRDEEGGSA